MISVAYTLTMLHAPSCHRCDEIVQVGDGLHNDHLVVVGNRLTVEKQQNIFGIVDSGDGVLGGDFLNIGVEIGRRKAGFLIGPISSRIALIVGSTMFRRTNTVDRAI